jgi:hypothetical protein
MKALWLKLKVWCIEGKLRRLLRGKASAKASVVLMALSVTIAMSIVLASTVFPEGALLNAGLLYMLGFVRWRASKRLSHLAGGA